MMMKLQSPFEHSLSILCSGVRCEIINQISDKRMPELDQLKERDRRSLSQGLTMIPTKDRLRDQTESLEFPKQF